LSFSGEGKARRTIPPEQISLTDFGIVSVGRDRLLALKNDQRTNARTSAYIPQLFGHKKLVTAARYPRFDPPARRRFPTGFLLHENLL
jgi:hypothetical protein